MKKFLIRPALLLSLLTAIVFMTSCSWNESNPPNILLIMTDDVTFDHWSCYGDEFPTPHIENLAGEGMIFHQAYTTAAACTPSRYSIMTGQYPGRCRHPEFLESNPETKPYSIAWNTPITEDNLTLHEVMKTAGYFTGFVGKFHIGDLHFDRHEVNPEIPLIDPDLSPDTEEADSLLTIYQDVVANRVRELTGADYAGAIQWANPETLPLKAIRRHNLEYQTWAVRQFFSKTKKDQPFFLTVNSTALHGPNHFDDLQTDPIYTAGGRNEELRNIQPSRSSIFQRLHDLGLEYGEGVEDHINHYLAGRIYMDDQLGVIMQMLKEFGLDENTLVIYTADHNIEPGKSTTYQRGVNVPFIAWWPENIRPGTESYDHIQFTDFLPTFAELGGAAIPEDQPIDGRSFTKVLEGPQLVDDRILYFEEGYTRAVTDGRYKYIAMRFPEAMIDSLRAGKAKTISHLGTRKFVHASIAMEYYPGYFAADQLYDLHEDPYEQLNLADDPKYQGILEEMQEALEKKLQMFEHPFPLEENGYTDELFYQEAAEATRSLGTGWIPWWNRTLEFPPVEEMEE